MMPKIHEKSSNDLTENSDHQNYNPGYRTGRFIPVKGRFAGFILFLAGASLLFYTEYFLLSDFTHDKELIYFTGILSVVLLIAAGQSLFRGQKLFVIVIGVIAFLTVSPLLLYLLGLPLFGNIVGRLIELFR